VWNRLVPEEAKQKMRSLFKSNLDSLPEAIRNDISTKQGEVLAMLPEAARKSIDGTPSNLKFVQQVDEASQTLDVELRSRVKDKMMEGGRGHCSRLLD
jgi:putative heme iron utilization protein